MPRARVALPLMEAFLAMDGMILGVLDLQSVLEPSGAAATLESESHLRMRHDLEL